MPVSKIASKEARDLVETVGRVWKISDDVIQSAKLAVSELVTNVLLHAFDAIEDIIIVSVYRAGEMLEVEVQDFSQMVPVLRAADAFDMSGRGMFIVENVTDGHGCDLTPLGKAVWFTIKSDWPLDLTA
jgi:anti-sigma regulatory factor (Ser/Thr protein kinase)